MLILGAPTCGDGEWPGLATGLARESWAELLPRLEGLDKRHQTVALFGLGEQEKYGHEFVDVQLLLHDAVVAYRALSELGPPVRCLPAELAQDEALAQVLEGRDGPVHAVVAVRTGIGTAGKRLGVSIWCGD